MRDGNGDHGRLIGSSTSAVVTREFANCKTKHV